MGSGLLVAEMGCFQESSMSERDWTGSQTGVSTGNTQALMYTVGHTQPQGCLEWGGGAQLPGLYSMFVWSDCNWMAHPQHSY